MRTEMDVHCVLRTKKPTLVVLLATHVLQVNTSTAQPNYAPAALLEPRVMPSRTLVIPAMNPLRTVRGVNCAARGIRNRQVEMVHVHNVRSALNHLRIRCLVLFVQLESIVLLSHITSAFRALLSAHARHRR